MLGYSILVVVLFVGLIHAKPFPMYNLTTQPYADQGRADMQLVISEDKCRDDGYLDPPRYHYYPVEYGINYPQNIGALMLNRDLMENEQLDFSNYGGLNDSCVIFQFLWRKESVISTMCRDLTAFNLTCFRLWKYR